MHVCISQYCVSFPFPNTLLSYRRCVNSNLRISQYLVTCYQNRRVWVIWKKNEHQLKTKKGLCFYMRGKGSPPWVLSFSFYCWSGMCLFPQFRLSASPMGHALHRGGGSENWRGPHVFMSSGQLMLISSRLCSWIPACLCSSSLYIYLTFRIACPCLQTPTLNTKKTGKQP